MQVKFHKKFVKKLNKLSPKIQNIFYIKLEIFLKNEFDKSLNNHKLKGAYKHKRSIDILGDLRAIFEERDNKIIFVLIGTHSDLYK